MKYDSSGRPVLAAEWNALQDIPAPVSALGTSTPGGSGDNLWVDSGDGAWTPRYGGAPPVGGFVTGYMGSDISVASSFQALLTALPVTPNGVYAAAFEDEWITSGVGSVEYEITSDQSGTITPIGGGIALFATAAGGLNGNDRNIAAAALDAQIFGTNTQQVRLSGVFSVDSSTTSVTFSVKVNAGSMSAKAGGYIILTRLD